MTQHDDSEKWPAPSVNTVAEEIESLLNHPYEIGIVIYPEMLRRWRADV